MNLDKNYTDKFKSLIKRHEKIIFSVSFFYSNADVPYDDLRQEIMISLFKGYHTFRGDSAESTWVYRVCINTCLFAIKRLTSAVRTVPVENLRGMLCEAGEDNSELRERLEWLYGAIAGLNPMDKAIILMWLDELSYDEIAGNLGIPRNTVASRLHRIKSKLSSKINEYGTR